MQYAQANALAIALAKARKAQPAKYFEISPDGKELVVHCVDNMVLRASLEEIIQLADKYNLDISSLLPKGD